MTDKIRWALADMLRAVVGGLEKLALKVEAGGGPRPVK